MKTCPRLPGRRFQPVESPCLDRNGVLWRLHERVLAEYFFRHDEVE